MRVRFDRYTIDSESRELVGDGDAIHLSPKAFDLLCILIGARPNALTKEALHARLWPDVFVTDANLSVVVAEVRRALGDSAQQPRFVRTVHRHGYAFSGQATDLGPSGGRASGGGRKAWLVWNDHVMLLVEGENVIGRDPNCHVWLDVAGVSRRHARLVVSGDTVVVEDLGSKNGTLVGETTVTDARSLRDGEMLRIGPADVLFRSWSEASARGTERIDRERTKNEERRTKNGTGNGERRT